MSSLKLIDLELNHFTDEVLAWHKDHHAQFYAASQRSFTIDSLIKEYEAGLKTRTMAQFLIVHKKDDKPIGIIKIQSMDMHKKGDIVYFIGDTNYLGKGLGTEAIQLALDVAFNKFDLRKIHGPCVKSNIASVKAAIKAGYIIEGIQKSHYLINGIADDAILVACFNPKYFSATECNTSNYDIEDIYKNEKN